MSCSCWSVSACKSGLTWSFWPSLSSCFSHCAIGSSACTGAPSAGNIKSAAANTHFVVGADRKRSCHQCVLHSTEVGKWSALSRLTSTALPLRVLICSLSPERLRRLMVMLADVAVVVRRCRFWLEDYLLHVPRQNISAHLPVRLDVSSIGMRHRIRDEFTNRPQS